MGDLYTPSTASPDHPVPAILTTNGFGGSKADQTGFAKSLAPHGYAVLSYSGLGFGGSGCKITFDDPDYDGQAGRQLISYLGGAPGIAYLDAAHTEAAAPLDVVIHDPTDHAGNHDRYDPRVGMFGGSYGGAVQFAVASVDPRLDTIVPLVTWNDLNYSLAPNTTAQLNGVTSSTPGALKTNFGVLVVADGVASGLGNSLDDPSRLYGCPNFPDFLCADVPATLTNGYPTAAMEASLAHASVASYMSKIKIPTLLMQGENDTLFDLNEAIATYKGLRKQGTLVKMIWPSWGHTHPAPAPGEMDLSNLDPQTQYESARVFDWFDHYLAGTDASTGPNFAYYRPWVQYTGIATPAYATSTTLDVGTPQPFYLSGDGALATSSASVSTAARSMITPPAGAPTSFNPIDVLNMLAVQQPEIAIDAPGSAIAWTGSRLTEPLDVVGSPTLTVKVSAPDAARTQTIGPAGQLVLFVKIEDVDASGNASLINDSTAPIRVPDVTQPITVHIPALVHRFAAGHSVRVVIAGGSVNHRGGLVPTPVTIAGGPSQTLILPTTSG